MWGHDDLVVDELFGLVPQLERIAVFGEMLLFEFCSQVTGEIESAGDPFHTLSGPVYSARGCELLLELPVAANDAIAGIDAQFEVLILPSWGVVGLDDDVYLRVIAEAFSRATRVVEYEEVSAFEALDGYLRRARICVRS